MTVEQSIFSALAGLGRVDYGITPANVTTLPRITFQQVGGESINFLDQGQPGLHTPRFQINCWAASYDAAIALARQVENALRSSALQVVVLGDPIVTVETDVNPWIYGSLQDFQICDAS